VRDVIVLLNPEKDPAGSYALSLADALGAHATALAIAFEPSLPYFTTGSAYDVIATTREASEHLADRALAEFERIALRSGVRVVATRLLTTPELERRKPLASPATMT